MTTVIVPPAQVTPWGHSQGTKSINRGKCRPGLGPARGNARTAELPVFVFLRSESELLPFPTPNGQGPVLMVISSFRAKAPRTGTGPENRPGLRA